MIHRKTIEPMTCRVRPFQPSLRVYLDFDHVGGRVQRKIKDLTASAFSAMAMASCNITSYNGNDFERGGKLVLERPEVSKVR